MSILNTILKQSNTVVGELKGMNTALKTMGARDKTAYRLDHQQRKYEREQDKRRSQDQKKIFQKIGKSIDVQAQEVQSDSQNQEKLKAGLATAIGKAINKISGAAPAGSGNKGGQGGLDGGSISRPIVSTPTTTSAATVSMPTGMPEQHSDEEVYTRLEALEEKVFSFSDQKKYKGFQSGGFAGAIPNLGQPATGDHFYTHVEPGSYVMNRNAVAAMGFQSGGNVPVALERGEVVIPPGQYDQKVLDMLNYSMFPRFQTGGGVSQNNAGSARGGNVSKGDKINVTVEGSGIQAIIKASEASVGLSQGIGEQCANTTREVLRRAGHPAADKATSLGDLDPEGTKYNGKAFAASFAGSDMGSVTSNINSVKAGDVMLWRDTYGNFAPGAITHVGIAGEGDTQYDHGRSQGWRKRSRQSLANKFAYGIALDGQASGRPTGGETQVEETKQGQENQNQAPTIPQQQGSKGGGRPTGFGGLLSSAFSKVLGEVGGDNFGLTGNILASALSGGSAFGFSNIFSNLGSLIGGQPASAAQTPESRPAEAAAAAQTPEGRPAEAAQAAQGPAPTSGKPYAIASTMGFSKTDWDTYRNVVGSIESDNKYKIQGGSGNHYDGRWQMGAVAKTDAARYLGVNDPGHGSAARQKFINDPDMQEKFFAAFTAKNHEYLSAHPKYRNASTKRKFEILGYAHNQGAGAAQEWLSTGVVGRDGFGTKGTKYSIALRAAYQGKQTGGMVNMSSKLGNIMQSFMMMNDGELQREAIEDMQPSIINMGGGEDEMDMGSHEAITRSNYPDANLPARDNCPLSIYYRYHPSFNPQGFNP